jgi:antitoxin component YwqK of YwqJK toxin-antitoxin module
MNFEKIQYIFIIPFIGAFLFGCNQSTSEEFTDEEGNLVIREWYNKTQVKSVKTYLNTEQTAYQYIAFYRDGIMRDSATYINDKLQGLRKYYDKNSGLMHLDNYKLGMLDGPQTAIFSSGIKSFEGTRSNNLKVGEWKFYYPNGKMITYEHYDSTGRLKYLKKYDKDGTIIKTDGTALIAADLITPNPLVQLPVSGYAGIALPEGCSVYFKLTDITGGNPEIILETSVDMSPIYWNRTFATPGEKQIELVLTITDHKSGETEENRYTYLFSVESNQ